MPKTGSATSVTILILTPRGSGSVEHKPVWRKRRKRPETSSTADDGAGTADSDPSAPLGASKTKAMTFQERRI